MARAEMATVTETTTRGKPDARACGARWRKEVVTDRASRYRANTRECRPAGERVCVFCGSDRNAIAHHIDGDEQNTTPENLVWACRGCNAVIAATMKRAGLGVRVRQYNPDSPGARTLGQWVQAVLALHGESSGMSTADAVALVHDTPPEQRSRFAREIWRIRRERGTDRPTSG